MSTEDGVFLTEARIRLLEHIDGRGSISSASRALGMSYKWAWDEVNNMNGRGSAPMVQCNTGGRHGGGASLTNYGRRAVAFYRALEREYQHTVDALSVHVMADAGEVNFRYLLHRRAMADGLRSLGHIQTKEARHG